MRIPNMCRFSPQVYPQHILQNETLLYKTTHRGDHFACRESSRHDVD